MFAIKYFCFWPIADVPDGKYAECQKTLQSRALDYAPDVGSWPTPAYCTAQSERQLLA